MIETFAALAEPNRLRIVELLRTGPRAVNEIGERLGLQQPQVSKHLRVLKEAGLVDVSPRAQQRLYALQPAPLRALDGWLDAYRALWSARFDELDTLLEALTLADAEAATTPATTTPATTTPATTTPATTTTPTTTTPTTTTPTTTTPTTTTPTTRKKKEKHHGH